MSDNYKSSTCKNCGKPISLVVEVDGVAWVHLTGPVFACSDRKGSSFAEPVPNV